MENKIIIKIGASKDHVGAYADNCDGIYGAGNSVEATKQDVMEGLRLFIKYNKENLPDILKSDYKIKYRYDVLSFVKYYITMFFRTVNTIFSQSSTKYVVQRGATEQKVITKQTKTLSLFKKLPQKLK